MKRAAIGVRMHSGWGALVAVSNDNGIVEVIERRRVVVVPAGARGGKQPYHFAKSLEIEEAERFLSERFEACGSLALAAVRDSVDRLRGEYRMMGAAVLLASGRTLPPLAKILASHSLIHTAEGEFYRDVFKKACEKLEIPVTGFRERTLDEDFQARFGDAARGVSQQIADAGRALGPPWTQDQKMATIAALLVLMNK
jgi:hypothetical protein